MAQDWTRLKKTLWKAEATAWEWRAASILLAVNGIDNALEYVHALGKKRRPRQLALKLEEQ